MAKHRIFQIAFILTLALFSACDEDDINRWVDPCSNCYREKPTEGILNIYVSINKEYPIVPLTIYVDEVENDCIEWQDTATEEHYELWVPVNKYYSVKAEYRKDSSVIYAVGGDKVEIYKDSESCDTVCWMALDGKIKLYLEYE